jgi:hypothetical protein
MAEAWPYVHDLAGVDERQSLLGVRTDGEPAETEDQIRDLAADLLNDIATRVDRGSLEARERFSADLDGRMLSLALTQRGMKETPRGSNNNPYSRYFGYGPQQWCADFVAWCVDQTGNRNRQVLWGYPSAVKNITAWAHTNGLVVSQPHRGAIFTYKDGAHTGIVAEVRESRFLTVEGNTAGPPPDPDPNYTWVNNHWRTNDGSYYFIRVIWFP